MTPVDVVPNADDSKAPAAESELCGSPPIEDDWEKVDLKGADEGSPLPPDNGSQGGGPPPPEESLEDFKDAIEISKPTDDKADQTGTEGAEGSEGSGVKDTADTTSGQAAAVETSVSQPPPVVQQPPAVARRAESIIATGLANVRLPMGYGRRSRPGEDSYGGPADSDDEEQFHDAFDSGPGMVKDASKAREMKETGNE